MRTTIDLPEALYRKTKAVAALRGSSLKDLIVCAVEHEISGAVPRGDKGRRLGPKVTIDRVSKLPIIQSSRRDKLDLTGFDFDELLG